MTSVKIGEEGQRAEESGIGSTHFDHSLRGHKEITKIPWRSKSNTEKNYDLDYGNGSIFLICL